MTFLKWTFRVLRSLFTVFVYLGLLFSFSAPFEKAVISSLALIYISVNTRSIGLALELMRQNLGSIERYLSIRTAAGNPSQEEELLALRAQQELYKKQEMALMVSMFFDGIIALVALLQIIGIALD